MEKQIDQVKKKLWSFGYSVKDVSGIPGLGYDLLVDNKHQVKVVLKENDFQDISKKVVVAAVSGDDIAYHVCSRGVCREEISPLKAFPKVDIL